MMTNRSGTLYIGVTNDLARRVAEHKAGSDAGFTQRYKLTSLLYAESTPDVQAAIEREKQLKGWTRKRRLDLIRELNQQWRDLSEEWFANGLDLAASGDEGRILPSGQNDIEKLRLVK